jgi:hypothetical protein
MGDHYQGQERLLPDKIQELQESYDATKYWIGSSTFLNGLVHDSWGKRLPSVIINWTIKGQGLLHQEEERKKLGFNTYFKQT